MQLDGNKIQSLLAVILELPDDPMLCSNFADTYLCSGFNWPIAELRALQRAGLITIRLGECKGDLLVTLTEQGKHLDNEHPEYERESTGENVSWKLDLFQGLIESENSLSKHLKEISEQGDTLHAYSIGEQEWHPSREQGEICYAYIRASDLIILDICTPDYFQGCSKPCAAIPLPWNGTQVELEKEIAEQTHEQIEQEKQSPERTQKALELIKIADNPDQYSPFLSELAEQTLQDMGVRDSDKQIIVSPENEQISERLG